MYITIVGKRNLAWRDSQLRGQARSSREDAALIIGVKDDATFG